MKNHVRKKRTQTLCRRWLSQPPFAIEGEPEPLLDLKMHILPGTHTIGSPHIGTIVFCHFSLESVRRRRGKKLSQHSKEVLAAFNASDFGCLWVP